MWEKSGKEEDEKLSRWLGHCLRPFTLLCDPGQVLHHSPFCSSVERL